MADLFQFFRNLVLLWDLLLSALAAENRVRAVFIFANLQIHEGGGGSRRGADAPENRVIII